MEKISHHRGMSDKELETSASVAELAMRRTALHANSGNPDDAGLHVLPEDPGEVKVSPSLKDKVSREVRIVLKQLVNTTPADILNVPRPH
ncbi:MAG TPA: hypothetical protein VK534_02145 [Methylomirabilota bacterium]|nr:hypothetical protein [Methylomirabilota bacterium]